MSQLFCDLQLSRRLEFAEAAAGVGATQALAKHRPDSGACVEQIGGGWAMFSGKDSPISQAFGIGLNGPVSEAEMDRLEEFFHSRGMGINIEHSPHADLSVAQHYAKRGYRPIEFSNDLFLDLTQADLKSNPTADGIEISPINPDESGLWTRTVCAGFAEHFPFTPEMLETMTSFAMNPKSICFLARINGKPAGGGAVCIHEGVGVVNGASTLPEFRGRGVQRALLLARLHYALEHGCDLAMTNTQPGSGSQRNVERLGFRVAYSRTKFFLP